MPQDGPLIVVANHPHGIIDGLALLEAFANVRPDLRVVVNDLLEPVVPLSQQFLTVSQETDHRSALNNGRKILRALEAGCALLFFPAGSVSHFHLSKLRVQDKEWNPSFVRLISRSTAPVLPVHIQGRNSFMYHLLYNSWIRLSLVWLIRELFRQSGRTVEFTVGRPVPFADRNREDPGSLLREAVYALESR